MTEQELQQKSEERYGNDIHSYGQQREGYIAGWKACESSDEYVKMKKRSEKWDKVQEVLDGYALEIHYPDGKHVIVIEQQK